MHRDAIGPSFFTESGKGHRIGLNQAAKTPIHLPVAGLTKGCGMVDVDAEENHEGKIDH